MQLQTKYNIPPPPKKRNIHQSTNTRLVPFSCRQGLCVGLKGSRNGGVHAQVSTQLFLKLLATFPGHLAGNKWNKTDKCFMSQKLEMFIYKLVTFHLSKWPTEPMVHCKVLKTCLFLFLFHVKMNPSKTRGASWKATSTCTFCGYGVLCWNSQMTGHICAGPRSYRTCCTHHVWLCVRGRAVCLLYTTIWSCAKGLSSWLHTFVSRFDIKVFHAGSFSFLFWMSVSTTRLFVSTVERICESLSSWLGVLFIAEENCSIFAGGENRHIDLFISPGGKRRQVGWTHRCAKQNNLLKGPERLVKSCSYILNFFVSCSRIGGTNLKMMTQHFLLGNILKFIRIEFMQSDFCCRSWAFWWL